MDAGPEAAPMSGDDQRTRAAATVDGEEPTCPLCGDALEVVEYVGSRWWYCDGDGHSYSREVDG